MKKLSSLTHAIGSALFLLGLPLTGTAAVLSINGDTTNSPVFNRTTETGALSFQNPHYNAYLFNVDLNGIYNLSMVASNPAFFDTYLHLYRLSFNPADPEANFLLANDDAPGGADAGSALSAVSLTAGTRYYLVADGFSVQDYGGYTATIQGPGNITASLVPEPSSLALMTLASAFGGWLLWRRSRSAKPAAAVR